MRSTFNTLFYINKHKIKKNGKSPIMCRITVDGQAVQFSIKEEVNPSLWSVSEACTTARDKESRQLNRRLAQLRQQISQHYTHQLEQAGCVTAESLRNALQAGNKSPMLLAELGQYLTDEQTLTSSHPVPNQASIVSLQRPQNSLQRPAERQYLIHFFLQQALACSSLNV
jgi:mevalonate kinase